MLNHRQLGITKQEYDALIEVKKLLALEEVIFAEDPDEAELPPNRFNMAFEVTISDNKRGYDCGTTCCIGGWMKLHMDGPLVKDEYGRVLVENQYAVKKYVQAERSPALHPLFYPMQASLHTWIEGYSSHDVDYEPITAAHAVQAIDNFLKSGDPDWTSILVNAGLIADKRED